MRVRGSIPRPRGIRRSIPHPGGLRRSIPHPCMMLRDDGSGGVIVVPMRPSELLEEEAAFPTLLARRERD